MKPILLFSAICVLAFTSCGGGSSEQTADESAGTSSAQQDSLAASSDSMEVDGTSGATQVANAPSFNGILMVPPQQHATITLSMGGAVHSVSFLPGSFVQKNQVILTLENPDFITLQQTWLDAAAQIEFLEKEYLRQKNLASHEAASQKQMQQSKSDYLSMKSRLDAAAAQLQILGMDTRHLQAKGIHPYLEIKAPLSGYVTNMNVNVGKYFNVGEPVCDVINKQALMLQLTAYEKDLDDLKVGDHMEFHVNGMGNKTFEAVLVSIDQMVDSTNRSIKVYARVLHPLKDFRPGMYVSARKVPKKA
ncbi:efflux RND transporter periplasmic adaptor subunit [Bacteroides ilei]|uniref:efflux RND transporter periplasmic adaptor subunit n=1 Tax=Bacteroides ilei TaxID=1907658 RepID=UPI00093036E7|nr:efflux RND transporter periplasmic adaptor subunit [Bacteroides ilei]